MDELLTEAAERHVEQVDGPLEVFLSGGFDSTFLVSLLREVSDRQINTYTWGWEDGHFQAARSMAERYGTSHTELQNEHRFPTDSEVWFYEEPQTAFVRYPFRELYREHGLDHYWTGLNSQATFPVCLGNIRKMDR
ncbi:MAG: asparagine synthase-related protein, partial [Candidatus Nanohaloarchaea archaeon]